MRPIIVTFLSLLMTVNAYALSWPSSKAEKRQKLRSALITLSEEGAHILGPKGGNLGRLVIFDFNGSDIGSYDDSLSCSFSAYNSERKRQNFEFNGKKCETVVRNLHEAGLSGNEDAAFVSYIECMIGEKELSCSVSQPYLR